MRKLLFVLTLMLPMAALAQAVPPLSQYHTIQENWIAPVSWDGTSSSVPCSVSVNTYCVSSYTETLVPPVGSAIVLTASGVSYSWSPPNGAALYCGTYQVSIVANWHDGGGNTAVSVPLTGTTVVPCPFTASPVTGLTSKVS